MTWQAVGDILDTTAILNNLRGCPYCGAICRLHAIPHAAVECCPPALERQIAWRTDDLTQLHKAASDRERDVRELQAKVTDGDKQAAVQAARAARSLETYMQRGGMWDTEVRELSDEIKRLKSKLANMTTPTPALTGPAERRP